MLKRAVLISALAAVFGSVIGIVTAAPAWAALSCVSPHCYSQVTASGPAGSSGDYTTQYVVNGAVGDYSTGHHLSQEMWLVDYPGDWIEAGYSYGGPCDCAGPYFFYAYSNSSGYHFVKLGSPNIFSYFNDNVPVAITYAGSQTWNVYIAGQYVGNASDPSGVDNMQAGLEVFSGSSSSYLDSSVAGSMEWYNGSSWTNDWPVYSLTVNSPLTGSWYITDYAWVDSLP
jgi:hypothetical protein